MATRRRILGLHGMLTLIAFAASLAGGAPTATAQLDSPLGINLPFARKVEYDPRADYALTREHGPWLIMCAAFLGESGEQQAADLVRELRTEHNLKAYIYRKEFDYSGKIVGKGWELNPADPGGYPVQPVMRHLHLDRFVEIAVMVGDFKSLDDKRARRALDKIKYAKPNSLEVSPQKRTSQRMGVFREIQRMIHPDEEIKQMGPMRKAFVTTNPLLPDEFFEEEGIDRFVMNLNRNIEFSLLKCQGDYSVRVATFRGESSFQLDEIEEAKKEIDLAKMLGKGVESKLAEAEAYAHQLTVALREKGCEAYEFHDRYESYVCIGSFDWVSKPLPNGLEELNPQVHDIMQRFKARPRNVVDENGNLIQGALQPLSLPELPEILFDVQPLPVKVPRAARRW